MTDVEAYADCEEGNAAGLRPLCGVRKTTGPIRTGARARRFCATASVKGNTMIVMEKRPEPNVRSGYVAELSVERRDISFHDLAGDRVRVDVTVHNAGTHRSPPT